MFKKARREKSFLKEFGLYIKEKRERSGLSQSEVAHELGYSSPQFISNFERGLCSPPLPALRELVDLYRLSRREVVDVLLKQQKRYLEAYFSGAERRRGSHIKLVSMGTRLRKVS